MRIAIFDSGLGGITVLSEALSHFPGEDFLYYADNLHVPYGPKSKARVREYVLEAVGEINQHPIKALVVACNTATSIAIEDLRSLYPFPVVGIEPAVKPAIELNLKGENRVLVLATELTLKEAKFNELVSRVDNKNIVDTLALPGLVSFCEALEFRDEIILPYLKQQLQPYDLSSYGTIVLGCTHFVFFKKSFLKILPPQVVVIDGNLGTVKRLGNLLGNSSHSTAHVTGEILFLNSRNDSSYTHKMIQALAWRNNG
ncbi:MAG: glutamate racemase [Chitinophagaceae bacterium]